MFKFLKNIFSKNKEEKEKFDYNNELKIANTYKEIHEKFFKGINFPDDFYIMHVKDSIYVSEHFKVNIIHYIESTKGISIYKKRRNKKIRNLMEQFFTLESNAVNNILSHVNKLKLVDEILEDEKNKFDKAINQINKKIEIAKNHSSNLDEILNKST